MPTFRIAVLCAIGALVVPIGARNPSLSPQSAPRTAVSGRVVDDAGAPLAGAAVTLGKTSLVGRFNEQQLSRRTAVAVAQTDADGRFVLRDIAPGVFWLSAALDGYVEMLFGVIPPDFALGTPIRLEPGYELTGLEVMLPRFGGISGTVVDHDGKPGQLGVSAIWQTIGRPGLGPIFDARADADGQYALTDLPPGRYLVRVSPRDARAVPTAGDEAAVPAARPAVTYFGGALTEGRASILTVAPGQTVVGVDIQVAEQGIAEVGIQPGDLTVNGRSVSEMSVRLLSVEAPTMMLVPSGFHQLTWPQRRNASQSAEPALLRVAAGVFHARADATVGREHWWWNGIVTLEAGRRTVLQPVLMPPAILTGTLRVDGSHRPADVILRLVPERQLLGTAFRQADAMRPAGDGAFEKHDVAPGRWVLRAEPPSGSGLMLTGLTLDGRDVLDVPFELFSGRIAEVEATVSADGAILSGQVVDVDDRPRTDVILVVFPADSRYWWYLSRRVRLTRPDTSGWFEVPALPAGDYLIALTTTTGVTLRDPSYLAPLASGATPVRLVAGETTEQVVRVR